MACSREFRASKSSGTRPLSDIRYVVIHSIEGDTARGAASWFQNPDSAGSGHVCVDDKECYRTLPDGVVAWGAPPLNEEGLHLELAAHASWTRKQWLRHEPMLDSAARITAHWCKRHNIPAVWIGPRALRAGGRRGITLHRWVTDAFGVSTHTDPGTGFPRRRFMRKVRKALKAL